MKNIELFTRSYRLLNIIDENETPSAEQGVLALGLMNDMLAGWESNGVEIQFFEQTDQEDEFPCAKYTQQGVIGKLSEAIAAHFGITMTSEQALYSDTGYKTIQRANLRRKLPQADMSHLPQGENRGRGNIVTGDLL